MSLISLTLLTACQQPLTPQQSNQLTAARDAVNAHQADQAIQKADAFISTSPDGPGTAEAYAIKGRGYELKVNASPDEERKNLQLARAAYEEALNHNPTQADEGNIRASLSNVAYQLDDYPTALAEASHAYNLVDSADVQSVLLYRMAVSQQRMGRFTDADSTFGLVQSRFPNSTVAQRSKELEGQRNFYVQLATYTTPAAAERALAALQTGPGMGVSLSKHSDASGRTVIDAGPYASYAEAQQAKQHFVDSYPDALIKP